MDNMDFEMVAASLRADSKDLKGFAEVLAQKLEGALPGRTTVKWKGGGLFGGQKRVRGMSIDMGERRFLLDVQDGRLECQRSTIVRGIALKTERMSLQDWIDDLSRDLSAAASESSSDRIALERLLNS